jgi:ABC-type sulfate transport system permease component
MPAAVYAVAWDTLIAVVRAWVLARARHQGEALADDGLTPLAAVAGLALWLLRLSLAPRSTLTGFRSWVITDCPVAPGLRPRAPGRGGSGPAGRRPADRAGRTRA